MVRQKVLIAIGMAKCHANAVNENPYRVLQLDGSEFVMTGRYSHKSIRHDRNS
jgi:hypothetical protein